MTYNDTRNWDQKELDRARKLAKDNVVSEGSTVPQAARLNQDIVADAQEPAEVLSGKRFTTEKEREIVESGVLENSEDPKLDAQAGKAQFEKDSKESENK